MPSPQTAGMFWQLLSQKPGFGGSHCSLVPGSTTPLPQNTVLAQLTGNVIVAEQFEPFGFFAVWLSVTVTVRVCMPTVVQVYEVASVAPEATPGVVAAANVPAVA